MKNKKTKKLVKLLNKFAEQYMLDTDISSINFDLENLDWTITFNNSEPEYFYDTLDMLERIKESCNSRNE